VCPAPTTWAAGPEDWERIADAVNVALGKKGIQSPDEHRRAIESLPNYRDLSYYERSGFRPRRGCPSRRASSRRWR
jgi:hypothetical protein